MGVRGLEAFVHSEADSLLEPYKLCKTTVIIDACNFIYKLFQDYSESGEFLFGGDYDFLYSHVTNFFRVMLRCGISPILLFDGCQPETKFKTIDSRRREKLDRLIWLKRGANSNPIFPMLFMDVIVEALNDVGIRYQKTYGEADPEIAALAQHLKCPVLSGDSDFFIYDVDVVPLRKMDLACKEEEDGSLYFPCQLYRSGSLSRLFPGLQRPMLPVISIIFGDSFVGKSFTSLFAKSRNFRDIFEVLQTIKDRESVISRILQSLDSEEVAGVERAIREVLRGYDVPSPASLPAADVETRTARDATPSIYGLDLSALPDKFHTFYKSCKLDSFMLSLLRFRHHYLSIPIEDINENSCHFSSIPIIREIYKILRAVMRAPEDITLNVRIRKKLMDRREICANQDYTRTAPLREGVLKEDEDFRRKVFFQSLGLDDMDGERLRTDFDDDWILFITSVVYWLRDQRKLRQSHLPAVLLTALCIYFESMGDCAEEHRQARGNPLRPFARLMEGIADSEYEKFRDGFDKVRRSDLDILARGDYFPAIHVFQCLQSILYHVMQLNYLLGELLRGFRVSRFYSGTFLFNLFLLLEEGGLAKEVMQDVPQMRESYEFLESSVVFFWRGPAKKCSSRK